MAMDNTIKPMPPVVPGSTNSWAENAGTPRKRRVGWTDGVRPGKPRTTPGILDEGGMNVNPVYNTY